MSQTNFYKYAMWILLLLNIAILSFFLLTKPGPPHNGGGKNDFQSQVVEILKLSSQQESAFRKIAENHRERMISIDAHQQNLLSPFFQSLISPAEGLDSELTLKQYQQLEGEKIQVTYQHFEEIKKLLDEPQLTHFEEFVTVFIDTILKEEKNNPPPREGN